MNWLSSYWDLFQRSAVISTMPEAYEWTYGDAQHVSADGGPPDIELPMSPDETGDAGASPDGA